MRAVAILLVLFGTAAAQENLLPREGSGWLGFAVFSFRKGTKALEKKGLVGLPLVVGCKGKVIKALKPEGLVFISGELWTARAEEGEFVEGEEVMVVKQNRIKLVVSKPPEGTNRLK